MRKNIGMITRKQKVRRTTDYREFLHKRLRNPEMAAGYLTAALEEGEDVFLLAVKDVALAQGGVGALARTTHLNREGLYAMLSKAGNPRLSSISTIVDALGLKVEFTAKRSVVKSVLAAPSN